METGPQALIKEWLPIALSVLAVTVSVLTWWDQHVSARLRLTLHALAVPAITRGCSEIELDVTNESSRAITLAPPFVADVRRTKRERQSLRQPLLAPPPFFVSLTATARGSLPGQPIFLRSQEAVEFRHKLTPRERRLLRADSRLLVGVTDYVGHLSTSSLTDDGSANEALRVFRYPCTGSR